MSTKRDAAGSAIWASDNGRWSVLSSGHDEWVWVTYHGERPYSVRIVRRSGMIDYRDAIERGVPDYVSRAARAALLRGEV